VAGDISKILTLVNEMDGLIRGAANRLAPVVLEMNRIQGLNAQALGTNSAHGRNIGLHLVASAKGMEAALNSLKAARAEASQAADKVAGL
jgi:hypothetical protein